MLVTWFPNVRQLNLGLSCLVVSSPTDDVDVDVDVKHSEKASASSPKTDDHQVPDKDDRDAKDNDEDEEPVQRITFDGRPIDRTDDLVVITDWFGRLSRILGEAKLRSLVIDFDFIGTVSAWHGTTLMRSVRDKITEECTLLWKQHPSLDRLLVADVDCWSKDEMMLPKEATSFPW